MTFVYPLLLGGLVLAALPVLLHFLARKKPVSIVFPAFRFLVQKKRSNTRTLRLKHLMLMLMRIALIVLICLALARPRLFHEQLGLSREKPVVLALIFDTSASMGYKVGEQTRLDLAKKRSLELLDQLPEDCRVLLLDASDPASFGREDFLPSMEKARQRIQALTIRPQSMPVTQSLDEGLRRLEQAEDTLNMPRIACVFSDRTTASWDSSVRTRRPSEKVKLLYFDVGIDEPSDLAITQVEFAQGLQAFAQGETIELHAAVKATGQDARYTMLGRLGERELLQAFDVAAGKQQTLTFTIPGADWKLMPGWHHAELRLAPDKNQPALKDALASNNERFVTFQIREKPRVLILTDDVKKLSSLASALEALNCTVERKTLADKANYLAQDVILLAAAAAPSNSHWQALSTALEQGKGVAILLPGDELSAKAYNSEAAQKVLPARIGAKLTSNPGRAWNLDENDLQHPFMHPFRAWKDRLNIDFLVHPRRATHYWHVLPPTKDKDIAVVVEYDDAERRPALLERRGSKTQGKVLLLTTPLEELTPAWNNYSERLNSFRITFLGLCIRHLHNEAARFNVNHIFGQEPPNVKQDPAFPKAALIGPDSTEEIHFDEKGQWRGDKLTRPGNYRVMASNPDRQESKVLMAFSMNIPAEESDLTRVPKDSIEATLGSGSVVAPDRRTSLLDSISEHWSEPMELFPWLMIGLLFLLALENLLANRFYRRAPEES